MSITFIMFLLFFLSIFVGTPIFIVLIFASLGALMAWGAIPLEIIPQRIFAGMDMFTLIAIPFFVLTGLVMEKGGMAQRLLDFATILVGRIRGGLAGINVIASMFFAGITGAASADTASVGSILIPGMVKKGYDPDFATAVTISSSTIGIIIPPSIPLVIYGVLSGQSLATLFLAGLVPGVLIGLALIAVSYVISVKRDYPREKSLSFTTMFTNTINGILPLLTIAVIFGGITSGIFTATEASVIAAVYSLIVSMVVYRTIGFSDLPKLLTETGILTGIVLLLVAASNIFSWILATQQVPVTLMHIITEITTNKYIILLIIVLIYLIIGCFLDLTPAMIILVPVFLPLASAAEIDLVHFGIVTCMALGIGLFMPPVGTCLAVGMAISGISMARIARAALPFFFAMLGVLLIVVFFPTVVLFLVM